MSTHRRVWIENSDEPSHPDGCRHLGTWCATCGCCQHCYHDCTCADPGCGCNDWCPPEPILHVVTDEETP